MTFSGTLIQLRKQAKITQVDMAKNLGVARQTYLDLESGRTEPRYSTLIKLSELFNVPVAAFFPKALRAEHIIFLKTATDKQLLDELGKRLLIKGTYG